MKTHVLATLLAFILFVLNVDIKAQGWVGISSQNSLHGVNSTGAVTPLSVGIGTMTPTEQLHTTLGVRFAGITNNNTYTRVVVQDATGKLFWRDVSTISGGGSSWNLTGNSSTIPGTSAGQNYFGTTDNQRVVFATNAAERMTLLNSSGNLGIGTSTPNHKLTISSSALNDGLYIQNGTVNSNGGEISAQDNTHFNVTNGRTTYTTISMPYYGVCWPNTPGTGQGSAELWLSGQDGASIYTNALERIRVTRTGFVGIGIAAPSFALDVNGAVRGTSAYIVSDKRYKKNISNLLNSTKIITALQGRTYELDQTILKNATFKKGLTFGFIAQEFQKVLPELVEEDKNGFLSINYDGVIPILVEAFKEKDKEIQDLKSRLERLELYMNNIAEKGSAKSSLSQNFPNPFRTSSFVQYTINEPGDVLLELFDANGVKINTLENRRKNIGDYVVEINGKNLKPGLYYYTLTLNKKQLIRKAVHL